MWHLISVGGATEVRAGYLRFHASSRPLPLPGAAQRLTPVKRLANLEP